MCKGGVAGLQLGARGGRARDTHTNVRPYKLHVSMVYWYDGTVCFKLMFHIIIVVSLFVSITNGKDAPAWQDTASRARATCPRASA